MRLKSLLYTILFSFLLITIVQCIPQEVSLGMVKFDEGIAKQEAGMLSRFFESGAFVEKKVWRTAEFVFYYQAHEGEPGGSIVCKVKRHKEKNNIYGEEGSLGDLGYLVAAPTIVGKDSLNEFLVGIDSSFSGITNRHDFMSRVYDNGDKIVRKLIPKLVEYKRGV